MNVFSYINIKSNYALLSDIWCTLSDITTNRKIQGEYDKGKSVGGGLWEEVSGGRRVVLWVLVKVATLYFYR